MVTLPRVYGNKKITFLEFYLKKVIFTVILHCFEWHVKQLFSENPLAD